MEVLWSVLLPCARFSFVKDESVIDSHAATTLMKYTILKPTYAGLAA